MSKFTVEIKLNAVKRYLNGTETYKEIAESIGSNQNQIITWVKLFKAQGVKGFEKSYTTYPIQFKLDVLNFMNETGASFLETASKFNISSPSTIYQWKKLLKTQGLRALEQKKRGRSPKKKETNKKQSKNVGETEGSLETLQAKIKRLEMENAYLKNTNKIKSQKIFELKHKNDVVDF
ncbi:helix-turn-helix domain-containing protein [Lysinibacillus xylanilyticus]|uniref:helix-turn-helix domain-containing protein n=1 Tax=Lysinibacillus xylanilyticus TaxID=582475 RepID=UPI00381C4B52